VNLIYYLRAKTEERHLQQDQAYKAYLAWIERNGIVERLGGCLLSVGRAAMQRCRSSLARA
jgi:hypothetical protein